MRLLTATGLIDLRIWTKPLLTENAATPVTVQADYRRNRFLVGENVLKRLISGEFIQKNVNVIAYMKENYVRVTYGKRFSLSEVFCPHPNPLPLGEGTGWGEGRVLVNLRIRRGGVVADLSDIH